MPHINVEFDSREDIRAGIEWGQGLLDYFVQNAHPGTIQLEGDTAVGRAHITEFGRFRDGSSHLNHSVYHNRYQRTPRRLEVRRARLRGQIPRPRQNRTSRSAACADGPVASDRSPRQVQMLRQ